MQFDWLCREIFELSILITGHNPCNKNVYDMKTIYNT